MSSSIKLVIQINGTKFTREMCLADPMEFSAAWEELQSIAIRKMFPEIIGYLSSNPRKREHINPGCRTCQNRIRNEREPLKCCGCFPHNNCSLDK